MTAEDFEPLAMEMVAKLETRRIEEMKAPFVAIESEIITEFRKLIISALQSLVAKKVLTQSEAFNGIRLYSSIVPQVQQRQANNETSKPGNI